MRRTISLLVTATVAAVSLASVGQADQGESEIQSVFGNIKMITRFTDAEGGWPGLVRRVHQAGGTPTNGGIGYVFQVDPETIMGRFELTVTREGGAGLPDPFSPADLGIYFYEEMGDAGGQVAPVTVAEYDVRKPGGETGFIAPGSRWAAVFMSRGLDVDFSYRGFSPMSVEVSETGFAPAEVTVDAGGWVVWKNTGSDFHGVRSSTFNSSPTDKHPMIPGATFAVQFLSEGDFTYVDPFDSDATQASGVVHVVPGPGPGTPQD